MPVATVFSPQTVYHGSSASLSQWMKGRIQWTSSVTVGRVDPDGDQQLLLEERRVGRDISLWIGTQAAP